MLSQLITLVPLIQAGLFVSSALLILGVIVGYFLNWKMWADSLQW